MKKEILCPINENTKKALIDSFYRIPANSDEKNTKEFTDIITLIDNYTRLKQNIIERTLVNLILKKKTSLNFSDIKYNETNKMYEISLKNGDIVTFDMISNHISDEELKKELNSKKRLSNCHIKSIELASGINNSYILTGYYTTNLNKILHSVVEIVKDGKNYILDWTQNIWMPKDDYIKIYKFQILEKINSNDLEQDFKKLKKLEFKSLKTYLVFRDEIIKDLEKNKHLFDAYSSKKR